MSETEYAGAHRSSLNAYAALAARSGRPLAEVVLLAEENRLNELFIGGRLINQPLSGARALQEIEARRYGPGQMPLSPGAATVMLRTRMAKWDREISEREQRTRDAAPPRRDKRPPNPTVGPVMTAAKGLPVKRPQAVKIPRVCSRCRRRLSNSDRRRSMVRLREGRAESVICEGCCTPADFAEMIINESTLDVALNRYDGLILTRPKGTAAQ